MIDEQLLFTEEFADLPVGPVRGDYTPAGEYHVSPTLSAPGRWRETIIHHSFPHGAWANWQVVPEADGGRALEQCLLTTTQRPTLAAGEPHWSEVTVEAAIRPMCSTGWRAIVFRYRHARRYYAVAFADEQVTVIRHDNAVDTTLGAAACVLDPDRYAAVRIVCRGRSVTVEIDGQLLITCADDSPEAFTSGCLALMANDVTRFRSLRVSGQSDTQQVENRQNILRARHPKPKLWRSIATPGWGSDRNIRFGDINGDGQVELVVATGTPRRDSDSYNTIASLAAYNLDGEQLWTIGAPDISHREITSDLPFQVHDWDGDGVAEVIFARDFELCVADGRTGEILRSTLMPHRLPDPTQKPGLYRHMADSFLFCDLTGSGRADCLLVKDRYKMCWAFDRELRLLWSFSGNLGHYPCAADIDGDGKDEIAIGHYLLDHDGTLLWHADLFDHADNVLIAELQGEPRILWAASDAGFRIVDLQGHERLSYPIGHGQSLCLANLIPERDGLEIAVNTFWGAAGITAVFDEAGRMLGEYEPMPYACLLQPVNWVPLSEGLRPADLLLLSTHPAQGGCLTGRGERVCLFPDDGHPTLCNDARDLDGDGIDEIVTWDHEGIWIYKADVPGRTPANYPARNPWWNDSNYRGQYSLPK